MQLRYMFEHRKPEYITELVDNVARYHGEPSIGTIEARQEEGRKAGFNLSRSEIIEADRDFNAMIARMMEPR